MFAFIKTLANVEASKSSIEATSSNSADVEAIRTLTAKDAEAVSGGGGGYADPGNAPGAGALFPINPRARKF